MKQRSIILWQLWGFASVSLVGTALHFLYDFWTVPLTALVSGVNESTWEHMKLLFFPLLAYAIFESFFLNQQYPCFFCVKLCGTLTGLVLIPVIFYTLNGAFGKTPDYVNIAIFFISAASAFILETVKLKKECRHTLSKKLCIALFALIALSFVLFTFVTPELPIFRDPVSGSYGI